eukprot:SAG11_NODE_644_length_7980_cov_112.535963_6_plen_74_part_00
MWQRMARAPSSILCLIVTTNNGWSVALGVGYGNAVVQAQRMCYPEARECIILCIFEMLKGHMAHLTSLVFALQ